MRLLFSLLFVLFFLKSVFPQIESNLYLKDAVITGIKEDAKFLWVSTYGYGVFRYSKEEGIWYNYSTKSKNLGNDLLYNIEISKRYVWVGSDDGLYIFNRAKNVWSRKKFAVGGQWGNWIRSLCYDPKTGILWIGRFVDLTMLDVKRNKYKDINLTENADPRTNDIKVIKMDGDSLIWFGTESGLHIYDKKKSVNDKDAWTFINNKNGFNNDGDAVSISDILFEDNYVWISTDEFVTPQQPHFNVGGIYRFDRHKTWNEIYNQNGLPANGVYCLARSGNKIWAGVYAFDGVQKKDYGRGLVLIDKNTENVVPIDLNKLNIASAKVLCMYFDGKDMWLGTDRGLVKVVLYNPLAELDVRGKGTKIKKENTIRKEKKKINEKKKQPLKKVKDVNGDTSW